MPTYVYESVPTSPDDLIERFEFRQGMTEAALECHPDTGKPIRRVITGGLGYMSAGRNAPASSSASSGGGGGGG